MDYNDYYVSVDDPETPAAPVTTGGKRGNGYYSGPVVPTGNSMPYSQAPIQKQIQTEIDSSVAARTGFLFSTLFMMVMTAAAYYGLEYIDQLLPYDELDQGFKNVMGTLVVVILAMLIAEFTKYKMWTFPSLVFSLIYMGGLGVLFAEICSLLGMKTTVYIFASGTLAFVLMYCFSGSGEFYLVSVKAALVFFAISATCLVAIDIFTNQSGKDICLGLVYLIVLSGLVTFAQSNIERRARMLKKTGRLGYGLFAAMDIHLSLIMFPVLFIVGAMKDRSSREIRIGGFGGF